MVAGTGENLVRNFSCTQGASKPEDKLIVRVQSYYCSSCSYMEFYRKAVAGRRQPPSLMQDADKALTLHVKEKKE